MELTNDALKASPLFGDQSRLWDVVFDLVSLGLILAALTVALRTTSGLTAPNDPDHFRDVAQAQTARDGHPLSDQYYRGEWAWYNPLLPWVLALGSALTHTEIETFHAQAGPWLNLLGPLAFYLLAVRLAGRRAALVALALYSVLHPWKRVQLGSTPPTRHGSLPTALRKASSFRPPLRYSGPPNIRAPRARSSRALCSVSRFSRTPHRRCFWSSRRAPCLPLAGVCFSPLVWRHSSSLLRSYTPSACTTTFTC